MAETAISAWLGAFAMTCIIVGAFILGERQVYVLWKSAREDDAQHVDTKHAAYLKMADAAHAAMAALAECYRDTFEDRMRIRVVYHGDTFASLIEMLAAIPMHELGSVEAAFALAGLKKNMVEAQYLVDQFVAEKNKFTNDILFPEANEGIDLRACKALAEMHYEAFTKALRPWA